MANNQLGMNSMLSGNAQQQSPMEAMQSQIQAIRTTMNALRSSQNPQGMMQAMIQNNPAIRQSSQLISNQYNGNGKQAFYEECKKLGVDPDKSLQIMQSMGIGLG